MLLPADERAGHPAPPDGGFGHRAAPGLGPGPGAEPGHLVRRLGYSDLPAVLGIERRCFPTPWSLAMFLSELSRTDSVCLAGAVGSDLAGYLICSRYDRVWHLNNLAVHPSRRNRGMASRLILALLEAIGEDQELTLEVRPTNSGAISLYERFGFRREGLRPRYYPDNHEDAVIMWRRGPRTVAAAGEARA